MQAMALEKWNAEVLQSEFDIENLGQQEMPFCIGRCIVQKTNISFKNMGICKALGWKAMEKTKSRKPIQDQLSHNKAGNHNLID